MKFGERLASGSRFLFWGIVPAGTFLMLLLNLSTVGNHKAAWMVGVCDLAFFLLALGLYNPRKFSWALRLLMALVYIGYCAYAADAIFFSRSHRWTEALHGLIVIGIPALLYATRGFATLNQRSKEEGPYHSGPIQPE